MAKPSKPVYECNACGRRYPKPTGRCDGCSAWNTIEVVAAALVQAQRHAPPGSRNRPQALGDVPRAAIARRSTGLPEFDFVLGGGLAPSMAVLVGGEPGIGKSTLLLQALASLQSEGCRTLYVSGEESPEQIRGRGERLAPGAMTVPVVYESNLDALLATLEEERPDVVVVDSVQLLYSGDVAGTAGSVPQVRAAGHRLQGYAKTSGAALLIVCHVTKSGSLAGPKTLEHVVDTVLHFEMASGAQDYRLLRASKNRYGAVDELGVFMMEADGLRGISNPSALFLPADQQARAGSAITAMLEGSRPLLVEVQSLVTKSPYGSPQRVGNGVGRGRLAMLIAVIEQHANPGLAAQDIFLNVTGGLQLTDPAADLALAAAILSGATGLALPPHQLFLGEVGLSGEVRPVRQLEKRLHEASRLGFTTAYVPRTTTPVVVKGLEVVPLSSIAGLLDAMGGRTSGGRRARA